MTRVLRRIPSGQQREIRAKDYSIPPYPIPPEHRRDVWKLLSSSSPSSRPCLTGREREVTIGTRSAEASPPRVADAPTHIPQFRSSSLSRGRNLSAETLRRPRSGVESHS
jgi:hypothetical protein